MIRAKRMHIFQIWGDELRSAKLLYVGKKVKEEGADDPLFAYSKSCMKRCR
jgi:hypothetical protein